MAADPADSFPRTVFVKELPEQYSLTEVTVLLEKYGNIMELQEMEDGHLLVRFQEGESARKLVSSASGKKGNKLMFQGRQLHVIPKRIRK
jgi:ribosomal protein S24E